MSIFLIPIWRISIFGIFVYFGQKWTNIRYDLENICFIRLDFDTMILAGPTIGLNSYHIFTELNWKKGIKTKEDFTKLNWKKLTKCCEQVLRIRWTVIARWTSKQSQRVCRAGNVFLMCFSLFSLSFCQDRGCVAQAMYFSCVSLCSVCLFGDFLGSENVKIFLTGASSLLLSIVGLAPVSTCTSMPLRDLTWVNSKKWPLSNNFHFSFT